jgi:hypothetical protein
MDQILYGKNLDVQWRNFLNKPAIRNRIWTEFQAFEKRKQLQTHWQTLTSEGLDYLNQSQALKIVL